MPIQGLPEHPYTDEDVQRAAQTTPLAGGRTYSPRYDKEDADIVVSEPTEFERADSRDLVYIADNTKVDVTGLDQFNLGGTVVIGGRHDPSVEAGMIVDRDGGPGSISYRGIFSATSQGHIEGIKLRGPSWYPDRAGVYEQEAPTDARCWPGYTHIEKEGTTRSERDDMRSANFSRGVNITASGCTVRNCDIHGFTHAGVSVGSRNDVPTDVEISRSMIHNCAIPGLGYPINIFNGEVLSEFNYFNAYRHSITGFGHPTLKYTTRYDVHGPDALLTPIDMHALAENGTAGDMTAGNAVHIENSTVLAYVRFSTPGWYSKSEQPAIGIRGEPRDAIYVEDSQFLHDGPSQAFDQRNTGSVEEFWRLSGNEYGRDNWTNEKGAQVDFNSDAPLDDPALGPTVPRRHQEARESRRRAFVGHLAELVRND